MHHFCPKSGLHWSSPFLTATKPTTHQHPVFSLTYKQLLEALDTYTHTDIDYTTSEGAATSYLLALACLSQYPGWTYRCAVDYQRAEPRLLSHWNTIVSLLPKVQHLATDMIPGFCVSNESASLQNLGTYLANVQSSLDALSLTRRLRAAKDAQLDKEDVISRLLLSQTDKGKRRLAKILPEWAALAADFPDILTPLDTGQSIPLADLWKEIIHWAVLGEYSKILGKYTIADVEDLRNELVDALELGTPYASYTLKCLRTTVDVLTELNARPKELDLDCLLDDELTGTPSASTSTKTSPSEALARIRAKFAAKLTRRS